MTDDHLSVAIVVSPLETDRRSPKVWVAMDSPESDAYLMRQVAGPGRGREFEQPGARFRLYARLGVYLVNPASLTIGELSDILDRLDGLTDDELVAWAGENAAQPPT